MDLGALLEPVAAVPLAVGIAGLLLGFVVGSTGWRIVLHIVAIATLGYGSFVGGALHFEATRCTPDSADCDLGFLLGFAWSLVALVVGFAVVALNELLRQRSR